MRKVFVPALFAALLGAGAALAPAPAAAQSDGRDRAEAFGRGERGWFDGRPEIFGEGRRGGSGDEHMGVFYDSKVLAIEESGNFWLSDTPDVPGSITWGNLYPRMVTWALFRRIDDGRRFYFMNTHLPYRDEDEPRRVKGAELIGKRVANLPADLPVVLTGDFNSEPGGDTYKAFTRVLQDTRTQVKAPQGPRLTFHDFTGKATVQLDWVLVRGFHARSFLTDDRRIGGVLPSDHFPLVVELDWPRH